MARIISSSSQPRRLSRFSPTPSLSQQNYNDTRQLHRELSASINASALASPHARKHFARQQVHDQLGATPYPAAVRQAFTTTVEAIVEQGLAPLYSLIDLPDATDALALHEARLGMREQQTYFDDEAGYLAEWRSALRNILTQLNHALPQHQHSAAVYTISVSLISIIEHPLEVIDDLVRTITQHAMEPGEHTNRPGRRLAGTVINNLLAASRLLFEEAQKRPYRLTWPAATSLPPEQLVTKYLTGTPFEQFFQTKIDIPITAELLAEMSFVCASIGHGKTQLMQFMIMQALGEVPNHA